MKDEALIVSDSIYGSYDWNDAFTMDVNMYVKLQPVKSS